MVILNFNQVEQLIEDLVTLEVINSQWTEICWFQSCANSAICGAWVLFVRSVR